MQPILAAVVTPNTPPPEGARLVVFADSKPYVSEVLAPSAMAAAARYARKYETCVVPQRFLAEDSLCLCLLGPDGLPLGAQRATHLNLDYREYRLRRDDAVRPFATPFGKAALLVDVDGSMPHVARAAALAGAQLLVMSRFVQPYDLFEDRLAVGPDSAARSNGLPVVAAVGGWGVICQDGAAAVGAFEESPVAMRLTPRAIPAALRSPVAEAQAVLRAHRDAILATGGLADAQ